MRIAASTIVDRPIGRVWEFISDPRNTPRWDPGTLEVRQTSEGPLGVGTTLAAVVDFMGRRTLGVRITTFAPNAELAFEFVSGFMKPTRVRYLVVRADDDRTTLKRVIEPRLSGWLRLLWPLFAALARAGREEEVSAVKAILEDGAA
jgi:uncharacterized protein YndB with AHSA1/START domain